jgi:two-component system, chemotaxis family, chemotaxis protein CheY
MSAHTVMVVDDSLLTSQKITQMLEQLGYDVIKVCRNGADAVFHYPLIQPDLVTMDITMPDMDGIEATKRILHLDTQAKIIMVTSHGQEQMVLDALDAGAKGYVLKPFRPDKLEGTIRSVLTRS